MRRMDKNSEIIEYYKLSLFWNLNAFKHYIMNNKMLMNFRCIAILLENINM